MLLQSITLESFGAFKDHTTIELTPISDERPIVLIGGLNGAGKTTLLDSIQLALYGRRAVISNRGDLRYEEYLRRSINSDSGSQRAFVGLKFKQWVDGFEESYVVERSWTDKGRNVIEDLIVYKNDSLDKVLTDTWNEFVEGLIPVEIAQLFFFDGEKIEKFARVDTSAELLDRAIHSLLGLNVVNELSADLSVIERQNQKNLVSDTERKRIDVFEKNIQRVEEDLDNLRIERGSQQNIVSQKARELEVALTEYDRAGGPLLEKRDDLEASLNQLQNEIAAIEIQMRKEAEGSAPLLLVEESLKDVATQHDLEKHSLQAAAVSTVLSDRDKWLLSFLKSKVVGNDVIADVEALLSASRSKFQSAASGKHDYIHFSSEVEFELKTLSSTLLPQARERLEAMLFAEVALREKITAVQRKLAGVPMEESIREVVMRRDEAQISFEKEQQNLQLIDERMAKLNADLEGEENQLATLLGSAVERSVEAGDKERIVKYTAIVRKTLGRFRDEVIKRHTRQLALLILDCFRSLLRKEDLITDLEIDPLDYQIVLTNGRGNRLLPERLSAGERQLLAVSILWGLARASGRPLPVIVDTPLGRLDATHRDNVVSNYFPAASHQVLLLSTDKEIDAGYYEKLAPFVSHSYLLEFSEVEKTTEVRKGYFEKTWHLTA